MRMKITCAFCAFNWVLSLAWWNRINWVGSHAQNPVDRVGTPRHMDTWRLNFQVAIMSVVYDFVSLSWGNFVFGAVNSISNNSVDRAYTWHIISWANTFAKEPVTNFPSEHCGIITLVLRDLVNHGTCCYLRFTAPYNSWLDGACLVETTQNLAYTAMGHSQLPRNVTWPYPALSQVDNSWSDNIWERPSIHEQTSKLVHTAVSCEVCKTALSLLLCACLAIKHHINVLPCFVVWAIPEHPLIRVYFAFPKITQALRPFELTQALLNTVTGS